MTEEIGRVGLLVNEFNHPFHPHPAFLGTYKKVKIPCVDSFTADQQLQWKNNLKLNTLSLIMSIGAVRSPREGLGLEYDGLFKCSNSGDL